MNKAVLVIDDDAKLNRLLDEYLGKYNYKEQVRKLLMTDWLSLNPVIMT